MHQSCSQAAGWAGPRKLTQLYGPGRKINRQAGQVDPRSYSEFKISNT